MNLPHVRTAAGHLQPPSAMPTNDTQTEHSSQAQHAIGNNDITRNGLHGVRRCLGGNFCLLQLGRDGTLRIPKTAFHLYVL
jgi:hypothetical protein